MTALESRPKSFHSPCACAYVFLQNHLTDVDHYLPRFVLIFFDLCFYFASYLMPNVGFL